MGRNGAGKSDHHENDLMGLDGAAATRRRTVRFGGEDISRLVSLRDCAARPWLRARRTGASSPI